MASAREKAISIIKELPKGSTLEAIIDKLLFVEMVEKGIKDLEKGKVIPEEEAKKVLVKWLK
jgi:predicted transcriptional regulator